MMRNVLPRQAALVCTLGYEINFNRVFYEHQPPQPLHENDAELAEVEKRILGLLRELTE